MSDSLTTKLAFSSCSFWLDTITERILLFSMEAGPSVDRKAQLVVQVYLYSTLKG
jgi:hypothetical protein